MLKKEHVLKTKNQSVSPRLDFVMSTHTTADGFERTGCGEKFPESRFSPGTPYWDTASGITYLQNMYDEWYPDYSGVEFVTEFSAPLPYNIRVKNSHGYGVIIPKGRTINSEITEFLTVGRPYVTFDPHRVFLRKSSRYLPALERRAWSFDK